MASISVFAWAAVFAGLFLGILLGKASGGRPGFAGIVGMAITGLLLGVGLSFATGAAHSVCSAANLCAATSDTTVWAVGYPLMFVPAYWIAMGIGTSFASTMSEAKPPPVTIDAVAIASALEKFRSGVPISEVCPSCSTVLVVKPAKPKADRDPDALRLTCDCGASNGIYVVANRPA
jgi:hypothetical protein